MSTLHLRRALRLNFSSLASAAGPWWAMWTRWAKWALVGIVGLVGKMGLGGQVQAVKVLPRICTAVRRPRPCQTTERIIMARNIIEKIPGNSHKETGVFGQIYARPTVVNVDKNESEAAHTHAYTRGAHIKGLKLTPDS